MFRNFYATIIFIRAYWLDHYSYIIIDIQDKNEKQDIIDKRYIITVIILMYDIDLFKLLFYFI